jgi:probable blue pigment (indigoidine) exporter
VSSVENNTQQPPLPRTALVLITLVAPVAWGSTYAVTQLWLPEGRPLFSAVARALPAGLLLLVLTRRLPQGSWWWRAAVLGVLNIGLFFALLFVAAYRLPSGLGATTTALSPLVVMAVAWLLLREQPRRWQVVGGLVGVCGVALLAAEVPGGVDPVGLAASVGAVASSALGFVLIKRWPSPAGLLPMTSWTLLAGGLVLLPVAWVVEGPPPQIDLAAAGAYAYLSVIGTAVAYVCWFTGLTRMSAGSTALLGLVNPVVGTGLGVALLSEPFGTVQLVGVGLALAGALAGQLRARVPRSVEPVAPDVTTVGARSV